jgi:2-polyprenyl-3-methyl-5-hydroxy-6-metoxy-1,4-benzoquinol methylase
MSENRLTTQETWRKHWSRKGNIQFISDNYCYHDFIKRAVKKLPPNGTCIELGGFPGKFSIFLKKYCGLNPTLLDFHFEETTLKDLIEFNGLQYADIKCIQADFFTHVPVEQYDMVCSFGLIEHFTNLKEVMNMHVKYMKPGSVLLINLPNFRGINGLLQKYFDPENLAIHNLEIMNPVLLKDALTDIGLMEIEVNYYPSTQIWLENLEQRGIFMNILVRVLDRLVSCAGTIFGMQNKLLSNSITILARSPQVL